MTASTHPPDGQEQDPFEGLQTETITLPDGRRMSYARLGPPSGWPVFFVHDWPSSRLDVVLLRRAAHQADIQLISPDRPGMGGSDPLRKRRIMDWPQDAACLASSLGIQRSSVLGMGFGAPFAYAWAAAPSHQIERLAVVSGPYASRHMRWELMLLFGMCRNSPWVVEQALGLLVQSASSNPQGFRSRLQRDRSPDGQYYREGAAAEIRRRSLLEAAHQGMRRWTSEGALFAAPWGIDLGRLSTPVELWHARQDSWVSPAAAEEVARWLPDVGVHLVEGEGRRSLLARQADPILAGLRPDN
jgi:pimeloyl-ACP methyl ester carboxylesterase